MPSGVPWIVHLAAASPLLVILAALLARVRGSGGNWMLLGSSVSLIGDTLALAIGMQGGNNQWLAYVTAPLLFGSLLLALAAVQESRVERYAVRAASALLVVASAVLAWLVEDRSNFSRFTVPLGALLVLTFALWTLVRAGLRGAPEFQWRGAWLWMPLGLALYSGVTAAYFPLAAVFAPSDRELVLAVLKLKSGLVVVSFVLMAWGIVCQTRETISGPSSSLSSSPSGSS